MKSCSTRKVPLLREIICTGLYEVHHRPPGRLNRGLEEGDLARNGNSSFWACHVRRAKNTEYNPKNSIIMLSGCFFSQGDRTTALH